MKLWFSKRPSADDRARKRLQQAASTLASCPPEQRLEPLIALMAALRPARPDNIDEAKRRLQILVEILTETPSCAAALREGLLRLISEKQCLRMFTDAGVLSGEPFFSGLTRRIGQRILPEELDATQMRDVIRMLFPRLDDFRWVQGIGEDAWIELLDGLRLNAIDNAASLARMQVQMIEALQIVSYRIAAIGLDPELVRIHPAIEQYESPFVMQNVELRDFLEERKLAMTEKRAPEVDDKHLLVLLDQCEKLMQRVRKQSAVTGASVGLTVLLRRLEHNLDRQKTLLRLIEHRPPHELNVDRVRLFIRLVTAENKRYSVREWWSQTIDLVAARITQAASKAGEEYITSTRGEYFHLFRSAMGAGFIVALMATVKLWLAHEQRAPFGEALIFSLNYAIGFILMYLLHFSLATKQPAMTANSLARSLEIGGRQQRVETLAELIVRTFRSQFIAVAGNLLVAVPVSLGIAYFYMSRAGEHYVNAEKAQLLLSDANPLAIHVWVWSAITGVCLFLTGLISGYYDNRAAYDRLPVRISQSPLLRRLLSPGQVERLAVYIENNFGGLVGSALFGVMLGSVGAFGRVLGLPIDTLHVTFTSANSAFAFTSLSLHEAPRLVLVMTAGVTVIGLMNLTVSFGFAIWVAMRAQRVRFTETGALLRELGLRLMRTPSHYFWPPKDAPPRDLQAENGNRKNSGAAASGAPSGVVASAAAGAAGVRAQKSGDKGGDRAAGSKPRVRE